jgi:hypothetical protein
VSEDRFPRAAGVDCTRDKSDRTIVVAESGWRLADAPSRLSGLDASVRAARCGLPGSISSGLMPSLIHQTESSESRANAVEAKGVPLSERIACGRPYFLKSCRKVALAPLVSVESNARQPIR